MSWLITSMPFFQSLLKSRTSCVIRPADVSYDESVDASANRELKNSPIFVLLLFISVF